jgi:hypothetical protein
MVGQVYTVQVFMLLLVGEEVLVVSAEMLLFQDLHQQMPLEVLVEMEQHLLSPEHQ